MDSANQLLTQDRRESLLTNGGNSSLTTSIMTNASGGLTSSRRTSIINPATGRRRASMFDPIDPMEIQKTLYQSMNKEKVRVLEQLLSNRIELCNKLNISSAYYFSLQSPLLTTALSN